MKESRIKLLNVLIIDCSERMQKMKVVSINLGMFGSTGKIMREIHDKAKGKGFDFLMMAPKFRKFSSDDDVYYISNSFFRQLNVYLGIVTGLDSCLSVFSTRKALKKMEKFKPDLIHLHNIHNTYINLPMLFRFIKKHDIPVVWTLHDCWAFTGHCPHFVSEKCEKWKTGCSNCPRFKEYPRSLYDNSEFMWRFKRKWFTGVRNMTLVTPSKWLGNLVSESYLRDYPRRVIYNGIDLTVFRPSPGNFREKYGLQDKKIVLGVSYGWSEKKGLDVFVELSKKLPEDYRIVLVGTNEETDRQLPENIVSVHKTKDQKELAEIYSAADVFVNPTREEVLGLVNIEALACGTPVITFATGGCVEIPDSTCGSVIEGENVDAMKDEILRVVETRPYSSEACVKRAGNFDKNGRYEEYVELYKEVLGN